MTAAPVPDETRRTRTLLWTSLALFVVFVLLAIGVLFAPGSPWTQVFDDGWRRLIGVGPNSSLPGSPLAGIFQDIGQLPGAVLMILVLPGMLALVGRWRSALFVIAVQLVGPGLVSQVTKNLVDRPRPNVDASSGLFGPLVQVDHGSFPSGHSVSMAALIITVLALIPASARIARWVWGAVGILLAAGMVWQRTLINAHWFSDTIAGLVAGAAAALLMWWLFQPLLRKDHHRPAWFLRRRDQLTPSNER